MASAISQAWCASRVTESNTCPVANRIFSPKPRSCWNQRSPRNNATKLSRSATSAGTASAVTTSATHMPCGALGNAHERTSSMSAAGADSVRRRLSNIFQRPMAEISRPCDPSIQGSSCQSPRAQRCCRAAATPTWEGKSSNTSTSLTNAQRANMPSNKSWLNNRLGGTRPASARSKASTSYKPLPVKLPSPNRS